MGILKRDGYSYVKLQVRVAFLMIFGNLEGIGVFPSFFYQIKGLDFHLSFEVIGDRDK